MNDYIEALQQILLQHADPGIAAQQKAYMRNQFEYTGIKTPHRRIVCQPFLSKAVKAVKPAKAQLESLVKTLWLKLERDYQYHAQELVYLYRKDFEAPDIELLEWMAENKSWWDTVDFIAADLMGVYFRAFPDRRDIYMDKWTASGNIWLQRCCLLFQLKYKEKTDTALLARLIISLGGSKEFFINKAIGRILREYGKTNPDWVRNFAEQTPLSVLSKEEALRRIKI